MFTHCRQWHINLDLSNNQRRWFVSEDRLDLYLIRHHV